jgi:hypothetical protein
MAWLLPAASISALCRAALLGLAAIVDALGHRAGLARVFDLAIFDVVHRLAKTALCGFFVNLGAAYLFPATILVLQAFS